MKYEMLTLTDEQREDMAAECLRLIAESELTGAGYRTVAKGNVARIALAALTAEPTGHFVKKRFMHSHPSFEGSPDAFMLYTAPPVPAMKLPNEMIVNDFEQPIDRKEAFMHRATAWNACIAEVKRLNVVKS